MIYGVLRSVEVSTGKRLDTNMLLMVIFIVSTIFESGLRTICCTEEHHAATVRVKGIASRTYDIGHSITYINSAREKQFASVDSRAAVSEWSSGIRTVRRKRYY